MKISIISDTHLGFAEGTERENDSFENLQQALEMSKDCDIILLPGDIFDKKVPSQETVSRALNIFVKLLSVRNDVEITEGIGKGLEGVEHRKINGIPIVAIHGTHERRTRGLVNPIEALEKAGFLIHLDSNGIILRKREERICIQGLSGVPDQYVEKTVQEWNPQPRPDCFNIFMLHQSLEGFLYAPHLVPLQTLPKGFDLYINGHIHNPEVSSYDNKPLVITGSTIQTQLNKESVKPRGFWIFDTKEMERGIQYIEFRTQRKLFIEEIKNAQQVEVEEKIKRIISEHHDKKPVIRIKLTGKSDIDANALRSKYQDVALLSFKKDLEKDEIETKTIEEQKLSVENLGKKLLHENLKSANLDPKTFETVFEMMEEGKNEQVVDFLRDNMNKPIIEKPKLEPVIEESKPVEQIFKEQTNIEKPTTEEVKDHIITKTEEPTNTEQKKTTQQRLF